MIALLLLTARALASTYTVTVCAEWEVDFADADLITSAGDDYYTNNSSTKPALGVHIVAVPTSGSTVAAFASDTTGCAALALRTQDAPYDIKLESSAQVEGNTINVMNNDTSNATYFRTVRNAYTPSSNTTLTVDNVNPDDWWHALAAVTWALSRRDGGMNVTYDVYVADSSPGCSPMSCHTAGDLYLGSPVDERYRIVHELGHAMQYFRDESNDSNSDSTAATGACCSITCGTSTGHEFNSKEHQSTAEIEGWAQFYAAVAFNNTTQADCGFVYYKDQDFDLDTVNEFGAPSAFDCEDGPQTFGGYSPALADADYLHNMCGGTLAGRGTEMDWLLFWWDFVSDEAAVEFSDCIAIVDDAGPGSWDADGGGSSADDPFYLLYLAGINAGFGTEFADHATTNGVYE